MLLSVLSKGAVVIAVCVASVTEYYLNKFIIFETG
jgi:hypothetical protein